MTLLSSAEAKGLEFDRVVLVEPWDIVTGRAAGWSELYVALSRATQQLVDRPQSTAARAAAGRRAHRVSRAALAEADVP